MQHLVANLCIILKLLFLPSIGPPYGQMGPAQLTPPKDLPENVEDALGTINDYLANPKQQNVSVNTTPKPKRITERTTEKTTETTKRTTTTTKATTKRVETTRKLSTTLQIPKVVTVQPKRRKPTSSIDDAKENLESNNVTIKSCMFFHILIYITIITYVCLSICPVFITFQRFIMLHQ